MFLHQGGRITQGFMFAKEAVRGCCRMFPKFLRINKEAEMRWLRAAVMVAVLGVLVSQVANARVPLFVRQTGLACNQCHVTWTPTPDLTFTGTKFRLNGYRTPWVAE